MALTPSSLVRLQPSGTSLCDRSSYATRKYAVLYDDGTAFVVLAVTGLDRQWALVAGRGTVGWAPTSQLFTKVARVSNGAHTT